MPYRKSVLREKKTYGYRERDEAQRQEFIECLKDKDPMQIVYLDEAGIDNRSDYPYGYSSKGERVYAFKDGKRTERVSWIAALKQEKIFAPMTFEGSCNRALMEMWLQDSLLPQLSVGDVLVMDNASFHKGQTIEELVTEAGCEILYLPPYSPDLNEIEHWWFSLKNDMRKSRDEFESLRDCVDSAFKNNPNIYS